MTLLLGLWICESVLGSDCIPIQRLVKKLECELSSKDFRTTFDPLRYDSKLLLWTYQLLSAYRCRACGIEAFVQQIGGEFAKLREIPIRLIGEGLLLSQLGIVPTPPVPWLTREHIYVDQVFPLRLKTPQLLLLCANVAAASHFGLRSLKTRPPVRLMLKELLPPLLLQSLRNYDLDHGTTILRTMRYAGLMNNWAFRLGLSFLINQQDALGKFGGLSWKEAIAITKPDGVNPEDVITRLHLPLTVSCLWALAESLYPHFTLIRAFSCQDTPAVLMRSESSGCDWRVMVGRPPPNYVSVIR
jgi:hypothetical protein